MFKGISPDAPLEQKIIYYLRFYRNTLLYVAVMVTIIFIVFALERIF